MGLGNLHLNRFVIPTPGDFDDVLLGAQWH